jgi:hypothetical protein
MSPIGFAPHLGSPSQEQLSAACFEAAAMLMCRVSRNSSRESPDDASEVLSLALSAVHHLRDEDAPDRRMLLATHWLAAKAYFYMNDAQGCWEMSSACLKLANDLPPLYLGYAYEALYRAEVLTGASERSTLVRRLAEDCASRTHDRAAALGLLDELESD